MRDHDRGRSGLPGNLKWLAGLSVVVALVGVCFLGWFNYTKQVTRTPEVIATARTVAKEPDAEKASAERAEAAQTAAAERTAAEKAAMEEARTKPVQGTISSLPRGAPPAAGREIDKDAKETGAALESVSPTYKSEYRTETIDVPARGATGSGGVGAGNSTASTASNPSASTQPLPRPTAGETTGTVPRETTGAPPAVAPNSIDAELAKLMTGNVAFNTPEQTHVGEELSVQATMSTTLKAEELTPLVTEPGKVETAPLKVSKRMIATLAGGSAFDVSPSGPVTQWVSESEPTTWTWIVTPKTVGEQFLILTFDAIITIDGKDDKRSLRTFKKRINVEVGWPHTLGEWIDLLKKWGEGASYFWGLAIAIIGGAWAWLRRRGRATKATADQASISDNPTGWQ